MEDPTIKFPTGPADIQVLPDAATMTQTIKNTLTILKSTAGFGQAVTGLSLQAHPELIIGSRVKVDIQQNATGRNVAFGSAASTIVAAALTGVASDRDHIWLQWDGVSFVADTAAWVKIVDAG